MQRILSLTLASFAFAALAMVAAQSSAQSKAKTSAKTSSKTPAKSSTAKTSRTKGKSAAVAYRQMQPTPQRYREIQQALLDRGYFEGPVDGVWGVSSTEALKKFQRDQNLVDDGKISSLSLIGLGLGPQRAAFSPKPAATPDGGATPPAPTQP